MDKNTQAGGSQFLGDPPSVIYKFYIAASTEWVYYKYSDILGFDTQAGANSVGIYFKGAKDVNAKDLVEVNFTGSTVTEEEVTDMLINAPLYHQVHKSTTAIITIVSDEVGKSLRPEFTTATVTFGTCCSGGGGGTAITVKDEGVTKTTNLASLDFTGGGVTATNVGPDVTVNIPAAADRREQRVNHSLYISNWSVSDFYLFPSLFRTVIYSAVTGTGLAYDPDDIFGIFQGSNYQRATAPFTKITLYSMCKSALTAADIAALGTGAAVKIILIRYTPTNGNSLITFSKETLDVLDFNATAQRLEKTESSRTLTTPLAMGDYWGIAYEFTTTSGSKAGNITDLAIQTTAMAWAP